MWFPDHYQYLVNRARSEERRIGCSFILSVANLRGEVAALALERHVVDGVIVARGRDSAPAAHLRVLMI